MYVGIDVAKNKSSVCITKDGREVLSEFDIEHNKQGFELLTSKLEEDAIIGMETTGNYSHVLYNYLVKNHYKTLYVDNIQMRNFAKLHFEKIKNDQVDARMIALYMSYNFKTIVLNRMHELKDLSRLYHKTLRQMTKYKLMYKDQLTIIFPELEKHFILNKGKGLANLLSQYPKPSQIAQMSEAEIKAIMTEHYIGKGRLRGTFMGELIALAKESVGDDSYPTSCFQYTTKIMMFYQEQIKEILNKMIECLIATPYAILLDEFSYNQTNLSIIAGEVGDIRRFKNHKKFVSYCGLDITQNQSGNTNKHQYITKRGNHILRQQFHLMVLVYLNYRKEGNIAQFYYRLKESGKHARKCQTATARKLAVKTYYDLLNCNNQ